MTETQRQSGFSLIEVLLAITTLAVGMLFVGGTFLLGLHFSRLSTERSIAPVVAEEAFAKMALYGVTGVSSDQTFSELSLVDANDWEYSYPSVNDNTPKQYHWTAIGRLLPDSDLVEVTVFVLRQVAIEQIQPEKSEDWAVEPNIMNGMSVISDESGAMFRASVEQGTPKVTLWPVLANEPNAVWFVAPSDGRNPCVGVFQRKIRF